jgi:Cdc25 family phosphatase
MPTLVRELKPQKVVVFHCALSQQRGPSAALAYLRERKRIRTGKEEREGEVGEQEVFVLDGGFVKWQEVYGKDERLTEGWIEEVWGEDGTGWDF